MYLQVCLRLSSRILVKMLTVYIFTSSIYIKSDRKTLWFLTHLSKGSRPIRIDKLSQVFMNNLFSLDSHIPYTVLQHSEIAWICISLFSSIQCPRRKNVNDKNWLVKTSQLLGKFFQALRMYSITVNFLLSNPCLICNYVLRSWTGFVRTRNEWQDTIFLRLCTQIGWFDMNFPLTTRPDK